MTTILLAVLAANSSFGIADKKLDEFLEDLYAMSSHTLIWKQDELVRFPAESLSDSREERISEVRLGAKTISHAQTYEACESFSKLSQEQMRYVVERFDTRRSWELSRTDAADSGKFGSISWFLKQDLRVRQELEERMSQILLGVFVALETTASYFWNVTDRQLILKRPSVDPKIYPRYSNFEPWSIWKRIEQEGFKRRPIEKFTKDGLILKQ